MAGKLSTAVVATALAIAALSLVSFVVAASYGGSMVHHNGRIGMFVTTLLALIVAALHERIHQEERR